MTNQEKKQCKFVIGIDLGHGETSAAICPLQWDALKGDSLCHYHFR